MDDDGGVLYLVVSGAPAPEGIPALVAACQAAGGRVVVFSMPAAPGSSTPPSWKG